jgi:hypothetical protein
MNNMHFVSKYTEGVKCRICHHRPASHKVGEEIFDDDPCHISLGGIKATSRHNLTAYVCCYHYTLIVGSFSGCPLSGSDRNALMLHNAVNTAKEAILFDPPVGVPCPRCNGELVYACNNLAETHAFLSCTDGCGYSYIIPTRAK